MNLYLLSNQNIFFNIKFDRYKKNLKFWNFYIYIKIIFNFI